MRTIALHIRQFCVYRRVMHSHEHLLRLFCQGHAFVLRVTNVEMIKPVSNVQ